MQAWCRYDANGTASASDRNTRMERCLGICTIHSNIAGAGACASIATNKIS
jgi:hypothetical protein